MNAPVNIMSPDEFEAIAALRPRASGYEVKLRAWVEENAESRVFNAVRDGDTLEISILDVIGFDWWTGGGVTSDRVQRELNNNKDAKTIKVLVNSPGGDVWEGLAIHNLLKRHSGQVQIEILALAASAASVIAMAGDSIAIHEGSMMMVHSAWNLAMGNARDMRANADFLDKVDASILSIYKRRTGRAADEVKALVEAETWMTAQEAVDGKFATTVIPAKSGDSSDAKKSKARAAAAASGPAPIATDDSARPTNGAAMSDTNQPPSAPELTEEEKAAAAKAVADLRDQKERDRLANHPLARARSAGAPPLGGMHK